MTLQEIVVLTAVHMNGAAPRSVIASEAATLLRSPEFDERVANVVLEKLCRTGMCHKTSQGNRVSLTNEGFSTLRSSSRQLGELKHAVDMVLVSR